MTLEGTLGLHSFFRVCVFTFTQKGLHDFYFVFEIIPEPVDMGMFLLDSQVGVLGQTHYDQFHKVSDGAPGGESFVKQMLQENVFMKSHLGLFIQTWNIKQEKNERTLLFSLCTHLNRT